MQYIVRIDTVGGRKRETRRSARKHMGERVLKTSVWRPAEIWKMFNLSNKRKVRKTPPNAVFRPWECFFRIPHAFLILLAGFSSNFAKFGPTSGHCSVLLCPCASVHVAKVSLFRPPMASPKLEGCRHPNREGYVYRDFPGISRKFGKLELSWAFRDRICSNILDISGKSS